MTDTSKPLTREEILAAQDLARERVEVPKWGGHVWVRTMTAGERDRLEAAIYSGRGGDRKENLDNLRARLVAIVTVDEAGERIFKDADIEAIAGKSIQAIEPIFTVAQRLNALTVRDVEELTKNSGPGLSVATSSGSPSA